MVRGEVSGYRIVVAGAQHESRLHLIGADLVWPRARGYAPDNRGRSDADTDRYRDGHLDLNADRDEYGYRHSNNDIYTNGYPRHHADEHTHGDSDANFNTHPADTGARLSSLCANDDTRLITKQRFLVMADYEETIGQGHAITPVAQ